MADHASGTPATNAFGVPLDPDLRMQHAYDRVWVHLNEQGKAATNPNGSCTYRVGHKATNPVSCAVGCLIEDRFYTHLLEDSHMAQLLEDNMPERAANLANALALSGWPVRNDRDLGYLLKDLQNAHDLTLDEGPEEERLEAWRHRMRGIANLHGVLKRPNDYQLPV